MIPKEGIDYKYLKEAFQRRLWYMAVPFFLISLGVLLYCIFAPRVYKAQTVILVEPQRVPGEYVSSTVTIDLQSRHSGYVRLPLSELQLRGPKGLLHLEGRPGPQRGAAAQLRGCPGLP